jgi:mRNA interferase MazF
MFLNVVTVFGLILTLRRDMNKKEEDLLHHAYNKKVGLAICCPITSHEKGYPFKVKIKSLKLNGVILADQIKNLDWKARKAELIEKINTSVLHSVSEKIDLIIK